MYWIPEISPDEFPYPDRVRRFDQAFLEWVEAHCRQHFERLLDRPLLVRLAGLVPPEARALRQERNALRRVVLELVEEGVPLTGRLSDMFVELAALLDLGISSVDLLDKIRAFLSAEICRAAAAGGDQITTVLLDKPLEDRLLKSLEEQDGQWWLQTEPADASAVVNAIRRAVLVLGEDPERPPPVLLVTVAPLRAPLSRMIRRLDPAIRVLSFFELQPEPALIVRPGGVIADPREAVDSEPADQPDGPPQPAGWP